MFSIALNSELKSERNGNSSRKVFLPYRCFLSIQLGYAESLDFHPEGELLSTMDAEGTCVVSDVNSGKYLFHSNAVDRSTSSKLLFG